MNDNDTALNDPVEEVNDQDTTPVSEPEATEDVEKSEVETESTEEVKTEEEPTETGESKKGYSNRVRELVSEKKKAEAEAKSLRDRMAELTGEASPSETQNQQIPPFPQQQPLDNEPIVKPGEEIDAVELDKRLRSREQRVLQQATAQADLRDRQRESISKIERETEEVMRAYPELDPENDDFDRELSDTVVEAVEAHVKANPYSASVKDFAARLMKPYRRAVTKEVGKATESIAKQASEAAQRPTSVRKGEKTANEKSIEELENELGVIQA